MKECRASTDPEVDSDTSLLVLTRSFVLEHESDDAASSSDPVLRGYGCDGVKQGRAETAAAFMSRVRQIYARHQGSAGWRGLWTRSTSTSYPTPSPLLICP